jgi:hypothetical protein
MTCIVAISNGDHVCMGGDSLGADSQFSCAVRDDKKVFITGEYLIGFTSSFRMGDLLKWSFRPPKIKKNEKNLEKFMATTFIHNVLHLFDTFGYGAANNNRKSGGEFLVGVRGKIFHIHEDYQVGLYARGYDACGCGSDLALGSLFTTKKIGGISQSDRVTMALEAAAESSAGVRPPWVILKK